MVKCDKLGAKNGRVLCPMCGRMTNVTAEAETRAEHLPAWCRRCGWNGKVKIASGVCFVESPNR